MRKYTFFKICVVALLGLVLALCAAPAQAYETSWCPKGYCHPAYLTYMQSTSCEMPGWMKHKLESRLPGEISITSDMQMTPPLWQKVKRNSKAS